MEKSAYLYKRVFTCGKECILVEKGATPSYLQYVVHRALRILLHQRAQVVRLQRAPPLGVDLVALRVEHLVVLEQLLADVEEVRLHLRARAQGGQGGCNPYRGARGARGAPGGRQGAGAGASEWEQQQRPESGQDGAGREGGRERAHEEQRSGARSAAQRSVSSWRKQIIANNGCTAEEDAAGPALGLGWPRRRPPDRPPAHLFEG